MGLFALTMTGARLLSQAPKRSRTVGHEAMRLLKTAVFTLKNLIIHKSNHGDPFPGQQSRIFLWIMRVFTCLFAFGWMGGHRERGRG